MKTSFINRKDFPEKLPSVKTFFCSLCGAPEVQKLKSKTGLTLYKCKHCKNIAERFLAWDPKMVQYFNDQQELVHDSVGVFVQNLHQEILLFKRIKYPFLWTIPAGHLNLDENPVSAAARELKEETGIETNNNLQEIFSGEIKGDSCVGGADIHFWHAYVYHLQTKVTPKIKAEEGTDWDWFSLNQIPEVTAPVKHLLSEPAVQKILTDRKITLI